MYDSVSAGLKLIEINFMTNGFYVFATFIRTVRWTCYRVKNRMKIDSASMYFYNF